ncbi:MAG: hypothetical protein IMF07_08765 [Proteobacteria bacterium]|nr:hypothetical protein [Pseudomonadota bacterium]
MKNRWTQLILSASPIIGIAMMVHYGNDYNLIGERLEKNPEWKSFCDASSDTGFNNRV